MMKYPKANTLVVRNVFKDHKDSTWALLKWAAKNLEVINDWNFTQNPLEATYIPTGQKILFRGFDEPDRLGSITVSEGVLCWVWLEEAFEVESFEGFDLLDKSIRGKFEDYGVWKRIMITFNPWVNDHWIKKHFFDTEHENSFTLTTDHRCNEFLSQADHEMYERALLEDPDRGKVIARGDWGIPGGAFFDEFRKDIHVCEPFDLPSDWRTYCSIDYGLDMLAALWYKIAPDNKAYAYKELHESNLAIGEAARRFLEVNGTDKPFMIYAPPDIMNVRQRETGITGAQLWQQNGVILTQSSNRREVGWLSVKEALSPFESKDIFTGEPTKTAKLQIFPNCRKLIEYLPQVQHDKNNYNDVSDKPHELTHIVDSLRYFCVQKYFPNSGTPAVYQSDVETFTGKPQTVQNNYMIW
jgi:phage terminase large subunit